MSKVWYFVIPMIISAILIIPVRAIAYHLGLYAKENERTVHHGKIARVGGVAIYLAFISCSLIFLQEDRTFDGLLIGATIIFVEGLLDDAFDLSPKLKMLGQILGAAAFIFIGGVHLTKINLPFGIVINFEPLGYLLTLFWIVGIINAINLIDGLDGLAGGFSIIVLLTICLLSTVTGNTSVIPICLILAGSIMGFLFYNFHPASIFMGDCGSQLLGYCIACISLYGFKSTTFITLAIPIMLLFVPISDTLIAIVRRKLKGQKVTSPDKGHLHHILMNNMRLGQVGAVLVIYCLTALFGFTAYLYVLNQGVGLLVMLIIILFFDIFVEYTGMISKNYRPILNMLDRFKAQFESDDPELLEADKEIEKNNEMPENTEEAEETVSQSDKENDESEENELNDTKTEL